MDTELYFINGKIGIRTVTHFDEYLLEIYIMSQWVSANTQIKAFNCISNKVLQRNQITQVINYKKQGFTYFDL